MPNSPKSYSRLTHLVLGPSVVSTKDFLRNFSHGSIKLGCPITGRRHMFVRGQVLEHLHHAGLRLTFPGNGVPTRYT